MVARTADRSPCRLPDSSAMVRDRGIGTSLFTPDGVTCVFCRRSRPGLRSLHAFAGEGHSPHIPIRSGRGLRRKRACSGVPTEPLEIIADRPLGFELLLEPAGRTVSSDAGAECAHRALEGAQGHSPGDETSGPRGICRDRHRLSNRPRYRSALPRRIARYPRRHSGHRLGRRRDGLLRGTRQRC